MGKCVERSILFRFAEANDAVDVNIVVILAVRECELSKSKESVLFEMESVWNLSLPSVFGRSLLGHVTRAARA